MEKEEHSIDENFSEEELKRQVEESSKRTFYIKDCPELVWKDFSNYCRNEHRNDYAIGLQKLMYLKDMDAKSIAITNMIIDVDKKVALHENILKGILDKMNEVKNDG